MTHTESLVTWHEPRDMGKLEGSDWTLRSSKSGETPYHLEGLQYPKGYIAAYAVNGNTGEMRTEMEYSYGIAAPSDRGPVPPLKVIRAQQPIDIGDGREIVHVRNRGNRAETYISPIEYKRLFTGAYIIPEQQMFFVEATARAGDEWAFGHLQIQEGNVSPMPRASVVIGIAGTKGEINHDRLIIKLDANGQVDKPLETRLDTLRNLGLSGLAGQLELNKLGWASIEDVAQQSDVMNAVGELLGLGEWHGLDLRLSAAALYANLGKPDLDIAKVLVTPGGQPKHKV